MKEVPLIANMNLHISSLNGLYCFKTLFQHPSSIWHWKHVYATVAVFICHGLDEEHILVSWSNCLNRVQINAWVEG